MENELQGIKLYKDGSLMVRKSETARYYTDDFYKKIRKPQNSYQRNNSDHASGNQKLRYRNPPGIN